MSESENPPSCHTCRYWWDKLECHRNSPLPREPNPGVGMHRAPLVAWPQTSANNWCGEHSPRTPDPAERVPLPVVDDVPQTAETWKWALEVAEDIARTAERARCLSLAREAAKVVPDQMIHLKPDTAATRMAHYIAGKIQEGK